jgi:sigma-B regulation protein RsbU (phosphoserine phosphatase)
MTDFLFDYAPCGFFVFADNGTIHQVNETLCNLLGYNKEELDQRNVEFIFSLSARIFYQTHLFPLIKMQGHAEEIFLFLKKKDGGQLPVLLNATKIDFNGINYCSCAFIVVHNRKKFEEELITARQTAEKALSENSELILARKELQQHAEELDANIRLVQKQNNELQQLNQAVTHDLKEPLRKILIYSERMRTDASDESRQRNLARLVKASEQMRIIVTSLQQYIWLNDAGLRLTKINLNKLIEKVKEQLEKEHPDKPFLLNAGVLPELQADEEQLQLMLYHILENALKFKKSEKALITITGTVIQQNIFRAIENKYRYEDFIKLEIRDEGVGFDPSFRQDIFELFRKLHFSEGRGLGLALCRKIAENHKGWVTADSRLNEFTVITILLPLAQPV